MEIGKAGDRGSTTGDRNNLSDDPQNSVIDLGNCALFPGLINAHCHLEFGSKDHPSKSFSAWARSVQASQGNETEGDKTRVWTENIRRLVETGTTTVVNHCNRLPDVATLEHPHIRTSAHLNIIHVCEIVGSSPERAAESYQEACRQRLELLRLRRPEEPPLRIEDAVVSPTSIHAVSPLVWESFLSEIQPDCLVSLHVKESAEENDLFKKGSGPLAQLVKERGGLLWCSDPMTWLKEQGLLRQRTLLVHGNYLNDADTSTLRGTGASVIHCPGSHAYFGHQRFPLELLLKQQIPVGLGTDSLASNEDLSMLREMRLLQRNYPDLSHDEIVRMATMDGAKALGMEEKAGSIEVGKWADLIAVRLQDEKDNPWDALLQADKVVLNMLRGEVAYGENLQ